MFLLYLPRAYLNSGRWKTSRFLPRSWRWWGTGPSGTGCSPALQRDPEQEQQVSVWSQSPLRRSCEDPALITSRWMATKQDAVNHLSWQGLVYIMFTAYECHYSVSFTFGLFYNLITLNSPGITTSIDKSLCTSLLAHDSKKHSCQWRRHASSIQKCSQTTSKNICQCICIRRTRRGLGPPCCLKWNKVGLNPWHLLPLWPSHPRVRNC